MYISLGPQVIKLFSCLTKPSMKFFLLIIAKMSTIVGMVNAISESFKARIVFILQHFGFFHNQLSSVSKNVLSMTSRLGVK